MTRRYDLVVVGGGAGGLVSALIAARVGARVALIERGRLGGDCLWTGCMPSKSLLAAADLAHRTRHADDVGLPPAEPALDFTTVMGHVKRVIATIEPHDSAERLEREGVEVIAGDARFARPGRLLVGERALGFRAAIIATGSAPVLPPVRGLTDAAVLTTDTLWELEALPARLAVLGGGPIGCELGQAFARLGSEVTIVEMAERLLPHEEQAAGELLAARLASEGVRVRVGTRVDAVEPAAAASTLVLSTGGRLAADAILVATGRAPRTEGLGLDAAGATVDRRGAIVVDRRLRTAARGIYAVGDVTGLLPFTHVAAHHARVAVPNALFHARAKVSPTIPWVTFTDPEVARVGLTEAEAQARWGQRVRVASHEYAELDRAIASGQPYGFAKLIADPRGRLVGATLAAPAAGEAIGELTALIANRGRLADLSRTVHAYPTLTEGPVRAADSDLAARYATPAVRRAARAALIAQRLLRL
ncbi:NAD(P)/FAD-dependent oxidoreductase [Conexibacter sp. DBS9H8]|uniref:dihydrolipoyl dehydrogenase family protein n=1 Tax=Conexibacter sp. DBS9H8 TaxID=2937801 RepID=UPI00200F04C8|nr:FAD-dependent oxidoreductase [Conexibacter sp. DBS9H8]